MALRRELSALQATALNMIDMVGIGPFITTAAVAATMGTAEGVLVAWIVGALFCFVDASVWSELGARFPQAGGTYAFLKETYGGKPGRFMAFLFTWQTTFQAPLVIASGALGIEKYFKFLYGHQGSPLPPRVLPILIVVTIFALLYRRVGDVGRISVALWGAVVAIIGWIVTGIAFPARINDMTYAVLQAPEWMSGAWFTALGVASISTMYSYLGYYNICHLGAEVRNPSKVIPRSMYISIAGIAVLYLLMQTAILSKLPIAQIAKSEFVVSEYITSVFGATSGTIATALILFIGMSSLFAVVLGYSRIPFAAAKDGLFFKVFSREHPKHAFPHVSLTILCGIAIILVSTITIDAAIKSIFAMRIFTQFIAQAIGLMILRKREGTSMLPWKMWLYPVPVLVTIVGWLLLFFVNKPVEIKGVFYPLPQIAGIIMPLLGSVMYLILIRKNKDVAGGA